MLRNNKKRTSYLATAIKASKNTEAHPYPYRYRHQIQRGFNPIDNDYEFNFRIAAYLDVMDMSVGRFVEKAQRYSAEHQLGTKLYANDMYRYINCKCKPKIEKFNLILAVVGTEEAWLCGYNKVANKEAAVEALIAAKSNPGIKLVSNPGFSDTMEISKTAYFAIDKLIKSARSLEKKLRKGA